MTSHEQYMQRCLDLALNGLGKVAPNPLVGSVIVYQDKIIGEGYHRKYGQPHAEVNAIQSVKDPSLFAECTLYVNLEPCCHFGKTPPCTQLIIEKGIKNVVIGSSDPFGAVAGKGIATLINHGIHVTVDVLKNQCRELNKRFFTFHEKKRPFIILKWAQTADGFIDAERHPDSEIRPTWITSEKLRMLVHKWRTEESAIMVGTQTALKDNPHLNVRDWTGFSPVRLVVDRELKLPSTLNLLDNTSPTLIFNKIKQAKEGNTEWILLQGDDSDSLWPVLQVLYDRGIQSVFVEGGQKLLQSFIQQDLWDEARVFAGPQFFGKGVKAPTVKPSNLSQIIIGRESFYWFKNYLNY
ncbi:MAG: bifunctional diaminohydroxyphosphoribosylaminopyrimidine deaminase/5-amino-6-(5-phosphoribosylamino)uracil reductase RibD [Bacteroidales bacterium]